VTGEYAVVLSLLIVGVVATIGLLSGAILGLFQSVLVAIP
jgi:Flp pilus assembly pilin Flp